MTERLRYKLRQAEQGMLYFLRKYQRRGARRRCWRRVKYWRRILNNWARKDPES